MCVGLAAVNGARRLTPQGFNEGLAHNTRNVSPGIQNHCSLTGEILRNLSNPYSRSGRKGRWRDGDGWEGLENLAIIRHQRYLQILGEGHKFAIVGRTT